MKKINFLGLILYIGKAIKTLAKFKNFKYLKGNLSENHVKPYFGPENNVNFPRKFLNFRINNKNLKNVKISKSENLSGQ